MKLFFLILILFCTLNVTADVFSLWPFSGKNSYGAVDQALEGSQLWTEQVNINGRPLQLEVTLVHKTLQRALADLRNVYNKGTAASNSNSLLFEIRLKNGNKKRYYLVGVDGMNAILQFSMVIPSNFKNQNISGIWPQDMPLPPGAVPGTVMTLPKRQAKYVSFTTRNSLGQTLSDIESGLLNSGWKNAGKENSRYASGGVFLKKDPQSIMLVSLHEDSDGLCSASLFKRKLD